MYKVNGFAWGSEAASTALKHFPALALEITQPAAGNAPAAKRRRLRPPAASELSPVEEEEDYLPTPILSPPETPPRPAARPDAADLAPAQTPKGHAAHVRDTNWRGKNVIRRTDPVPDAAWSLLVEPADVDLETLFQLARVASLLERRDRPGDLPPLVDLLVDEAERRLRTAAFARGGTWGSTTTLGGLDIGDPVAVVSNGDHPLLDPTVDALRRRGVLVERTRELRADVRHTLVYGRPGVLAALEVGLPLADEAPTEEALARLSAAWIVGEHPGTAPRCAFRAHQAAFLDPAMLAPAGEAVLLLPSALPTEHPGGATFLADDGTLRFSPRVLGHAVEGPRPGWEIAVQVAAHADVDGATDLAAHDASELRACIAATLPRLAGVGALAAPGDTAALRA